MLDRHQWPDEGLRPRDTVSDARTSGKTPAARAAAKAAMPDVVVEVDADSGGQSDRPKTADAARQNGVGSNGQASGNRARKRAGQRNDVAKNQSSNSKKKSAARAAKADPPLKLADSAEVPALEDSNAPIPADDTPSKSDSDGEIGRAIKAVQEERDAAARTDVAQNTVTGSGGSGGFETMLGRIVVRSGIATEEEVASVSKELETAADESAGGADESPRTLADILIAREYATRHQLSRLRDDFEAKRSGRSIPGFKVKRKLGAGAMATVFLAKQISLDRLVAIKILPKKFSNNSTFIERFYKEGRAAAQLNHTNIVQAYDVGSAGGHHYFVMEYVDGPSVYDRIVESKRFDEKEAIHIVLGTTMALKHAHEKGFIHRDVKPKNIMITKSGRVKLADLGLARALSDKESAEAEAGRAYGTPYYISPEQIRGEVDIGPPADIYGLGATFYHMVTGRVPYEGRNPSAVMHKHLKQQLEPPDHVNPALSPHTAQVIEMMLAKRKDERYQSANDLIEDLELVAQGKPPHFAHRSLDSVSLTQTLSDVAISAPTAAAPIKMEKKSGGSIGDSPLFLVTGVVAVISVILNLILLALMLAD